MSDLLEIKIPASFVIERWGLPTAAELGYGHRMGWIKRRDVVEVALAKYEAGMLLAPAEEELALLLADELDRVDELAAVLEVSDEAAELRGRYWALAVLAWLLDHRTEFHDALGLIDLIYADFEYPADVAPLASVTPLGPGDAPGEAGVVQRWHDSVERWRAEYRNRDLGFMRTR